MKKITCELLDKPGFVFIDPWDVDSCHPEKVEVSGKTIVGTKVHLQHRTYRIRKPLEEFVKEVESEMAKDTSSGIAWSRTSRG